MVNINCIICFLFSDSIYSQVSAFWLACLTVVCHTTTCMNNNLMVQIQPEITLERRAHCNELKAVANEPQPCYRQTTSLAKSMLARRCHSADRIQQDTSTPGGDEIPSVEHKNQEQIQWLMYCSLCSFTAIQFIHNFSHMMWQCQGDNCGSFTAFVQADLSRNVTDDPRNKQLLAVHLCLANLPLRGSSLAFLSWTHHWTLKWTVSFGYLLMFSRNRWPKYFHAGTLGFDTKGISY